MHQGGYQILTAPCKIRVGKAVIFQQNSLQEMASARVWAQTAVMSPGTEIPKMAWANALEAYTFLPQICEALAGLFAFSERLSVS